MAAYTKITLTQFTTLVRARLGPSAFWTDDEIRQNINAALRTWNCLTGFWAGTATFVTTANYPYYALPAALVFGARATLDGVLLQPSSIFNWDQLDPYWMFRSGLPAEWAPIGVGIVALRPVDPSGGHTIVVEGISVTPVLTVAGDFIQLGEEDFAAILDYVLHLLTFKEGGAEFFATQAQLKTFVAAAGVRNEKLRASALYRRILGIVPDPQQKPWRRKAADGMEVGVR